MALILKNLVKESTTTTGTGPLTLAGAYTGMRPFSAFCANGDTVFYAIGNPGDAEREVGLGTWGTGNILTRTSIFESSNADAVVSLSAGTKPVYLVMPADFAGGVASGATVPAVAMEGAAFLHTPTGRTVFLRYAAGAWRAQHSYGTMTIYVDGASGTNSINKGTGTGANAYATVQYAIDSIPSSYAGNIAINISAATYAEDVVIVGKTPSGNYSITLTGTRTTLDTLTSSASTQGSGATQGTVVRSSGTWTASARANKMVRFTAGVNSGVTRIIDSNTTTTLTIVEVWPGGAPGTDAFVVEDWGTVIRSLTIGQMQTNVFLFDLSLVSAAGSFALTILQGGSAYPNNVSVSVAAGSTTFGVVLIAGLAAFDTCFITNASNGDRILTSDASSIIKLDRTKVLANSSNTFYTVLMQGGTLRLQSGNVIDANGGQDGVELETAGMSAYTGNSHNRIRNAGTAGINAVFGASAHYTASGTYVEFSGNGSNTVADAATYSSIS